MRKMKKVLALSLSAILLLGSLTACGKKSEGGDPTSAPSSGQDKGSSAAASDTSEFVTIRMMFEGSDGVTDDSAVMAKVNEYLKEKLNMKLEPVWVTWDDYAQGTPVREINSGSNIDIYFTCSWTPNEYSQFSRKGAYVRLDDPSNDILAKYGKDIWNLLPDTLKEVATIPGKSGTGVYAVPGYKDIATQNCWDVNVPMLTKYGYTVDDIKNTNFYDLGPILEKVKQGEGDSFYPLIIEGVVLERMVDNSVIVTGDNNDGNMLSYYLNPTNLSQTGVNGNKIVSKFETPEYKKFIEKMREYYLAGYVDPNLAIEAQANSVRSTKTQDGKYLLATQVYDLGYEVEASALRGFEVAMVPWTNPYCDTTSAQGAMYAISTVSKNPERAMMFLNLLHTDKYLATLMAYGVEGTNYTLNDERISLVADNTYRPWVNGIGNSTILPPVEGQAKDFKQQYIAYYNSAEKTPILGFAFDNTEYQAEMAAIAQVVKEYVLALNIGAVDPATELPKFIDKLKANGIDKVVAAADQQFQDFLKAKGE